ncbi:shikimate dehydrogenase, partial [Variovorax sp. CT11-76]
GEAELLVNATPVGMRADDPLPVPASALRTGLWVAEVIMAPAVTPLLQLARERGCIAHEGRHMMERQLGLMADFFEPAILAMAPERLEVAA